MVKIECWLSSGLWVQCKFHANKMRPALCDFYIEDQKQYAKLSD